MVEKPTQGQESAPAGQTPIAQEPAPTPTVDPAVAELQRKVEELGKQIADKDRFITELQAEKQTLETRFNQLNRPPETQVIDTDLQGKTTEILEIAQVDPQKAGEKLAYLIKTAATKAQEETLRNLEPIISQQTYVNEVKSKNQDLIDLGLEPAISLRAGQLMQAGKSFKDAVDTAVREAREKVEKLKSNTPTPPTPPPPGAVGEGGANMQPTPPPPPKEITPEDEIMALKERRRKMGL